MSGIEAAGFAPTFAPRVDASRATGGPEGPSGPSAAAASQDFGDLVMNGLDRLAQVQQKSDALAVQAASGDLQSIHDYTIAATEAAVTTQVTVAVRNKALEAFTEIMRMQA